MNDAVLRPTIARFITETFLFEFDSSITADTNLFETGLLDSFGFTQLIAFLEETFDITLSEDEFSSDDMSSLNGLVRIVTRLRQPLQERSGDTA